MTDREDKPEDREARPEGREDRPAARDESAEIRRLEDRLRQLTLRSPGPDLDRRISAQRPDPGRLPSSPPWWRRAIAVPWPVAAVFAVLFAVLLVRELPDRFRARPTGGRGPEPAFEPYSGASGTPRRVEAALYVPGRGVVFHKVEIR